ncbi:MAG: universal stress protein [Cyanobacteria bacterium P01_C01_bin.69]
MRSIPFQTIMVAIDSTEVSHKAFNKAVSIAKALDAKLLITHVLSFRDADSPRPIHSYSTPDTIVIDEAIHQQYQRDWNAYVEHYEALLKQKIEEAQAEGVEAESMQPQGATGRVLCKVARTSEVDLLVVGSHQRRGISELMMGSTSNYIMHHAPCSVLVVHPYTATKTTLNDADISVPTRRMVGV